MRGRHPRRARAKTRALYRRAHWPKMTQNRGLQGCFLTRKTRKTGRPKCSAGPTRWCAVSRKNISFFPEFFPHGFLNRCHSRQAASKSFRPDSSGGRRSGATLKRRRCCCRLRVAVGARQDPGFHVLPVSSPFNKISHGLRVRELPVVTAPIIPTTEWLHNPSSTAAPEIIEPPPGYEEIRPRSTDPNDGNGVTQSFRHLSDGLRLYVVGCPTMTAIEVEKPYQIRNHFQDIAKRFNLDFRRAGMGKPISHLNGFAY